MCNVDDIIVEVLPIDFNAPSVKSLCAVIALWSLRHQSKKVRP